MFYIFHSGEWVATLRIIETSFAFVKYKETILLIIMEKKLVFNNIANRLSKALFVTSGYITEAKIPPDVLRNFHEPNPENSKIIFFDNVDIPNISILFLYESRLLNTAFYNDYCTRGSIKYIVVTLKSGNIVGITRNSAVTLFNNILRKAI